MPAALTSQSCSPSPGTGSGRSTTSRTSGPPKRVICTARLQVRPGLHPRPQVVSVARGEVRRGNRSREVPLRARGGRSARGPEGPADAHGGQLSSTAHASDADLRDQVMRRLQEALRPEFLNRIDEIVVFQQLDNTQLERITDLMLDQPRRRLRAQGIEVEFTPEAVSWLAERGFEP